MILDLKDGKLQGSRKQEEGKTFNKLHALGINDDLWDKVHGVDRMHGTCQLSWELLLDPSGFHRLFLSGCLLAVAFSLLCNACV